MEQVFGKKWLAYAKAHVEGCDYYFNYGFEMPEELYHYLLDMVNRKIPITSCDRYEEVLTYAQIAIDYRKLCGYDWEFYGREDEEDERDGDYWKYIKEFNSDRDRVNAELIYIRLFDPYAEGELIDYCLEIPIDFDLTKQKKKFLWYDNGDCYKWSLEPYGADDYSVSRVSLSVRDAEYTKMLNGRHSVYPPYRKILEALKNGEVDIIYEDI